jgi:single-strand DNA-binding protein
MAGFNKIIMLGNLTRNPELKYTPSGTPVCTFGLAVNRRFKQGDELKEEVTFVDVVAFGKMAENIAQYQVKGNMLHVEGRLQQQRWETESGDKRSKHQIVAEGVTFMPKRDGQGGESHSEEEPPF